MPETPTLVLGAGAAGLAAAWTLVQAGVPVIVIEARDRAGGRIWTRHAAASTAPIELGAEFIHGEPEVTFSLLARAGLAAVEATGRHYALRGGRLVPADDRNRRLQAALRAGEALEEGDLPFADYLDRLRLPAAVRAHAIALVEGYDAADPAVVSARSIVEEWGGGASADAATFRPAGGYGALVAWLCNAVAAGGAHLRFQSPVRAVHWSADGVTVEGACRGERFTEHARCAVVTLPLGVLQSGAVSFAPALEAKHEALDRLAAGAVRKIVFEFRHAFWETGEHGARDLAFLHASGSAYPTYWTMKPARVPLLVAWAGGPRVPHGESDDAAVARALDDLRRLFGGAVDEAGLVAAHTHDWQGDPYSRGAYSSVKVNGGAARGQLARPLEDALFFAGEAADTEGEAGTVAGALQSGERAAREVLRSVYHRSSPR